MIGSQWLYAAAIALQEGERRLQGVLVSLDHRKSRIKLDEILIAREVLELAGGQGARGRENAARIRGQGAHCNQTAGELIDKLRS